MSVAVETALLPLTNPGPGFASVMVVAYSLGRWASPGRAVIGLLADAAAVVVAQGAAPQSYSRTAALAFLLPSLVAAPAAVGAFVRRRATIVARLEEATVQLQTAKQERAQIAVRDYRKKAAADLHVTILVGLDEMRRHNLSAGLPAVRGVESAARETLARLRALLSRWSEPSPAVVAEPVAEVLRERLAHLLTAVDGAAGDSAADRPLSGRTYSRRWVLPSALEVDVLLTIAALAVAAVTVGEASGAPGLGVVLALPAAAAIALSRRQPLVAAALTVASVSGWAAVAAPVDATGGVVITGALTAVPAGVAFRYDRWTASAVITGIAAAVALAPVISPAATFRLADVLPAVGIVFAAAGAGRVLGGQSGLMAEYAATLTALADEQRRLATDRLTEERMRVAHDVHDAVGHSLTAILFQATAARRVWERDPVVAGQHLLQLAQAIDVAFMELRPMVVTLSIGDTTGTEDTRDLAALVSRARLAGIDVDAILPDDPARLEGLSAPVYRIVQEGLTNAARHASGRKVRVAVTTDQAGVRVEVTNTGSSAVAQEIDVQGTGRGLSGVAERARRLGGSVSAAPNNDGGFTLLAHLPTSQIT